MGSHFVFIDVSKSILDKIIKLGRDGETNVGCVEAQLQGEAQPASQWSLSTQYAVEKGFLTLTLWAFGAA